MGMIVRTNIMAVNANNNLSKNSNKVSKSLEKLSSGFRINRAADDASGLAMSEKMKAQITALDAASANCQDGISLIQTAEGYTTEIHDMLNRMVELAEKSANGVMETVSGGIDAEAYGAAATDRQALQDEMDQLCAEIDRIAQTANFNNLKLFDGTLDANAIIGSVDAAEQAAALATLKSFVDGFTPANFADYDFAAQADLQALQDAADGSEMLTLMEDPKYDAFKTYLDDNSTQWADYNATLGTTGTKLKLQIGETDTAADKLSINITRLTTDYIFENIAANVTYSGTGSGLTLTVANESSTFNGGLTLNISNQDAASSSAVAIRDVINNVSSLRARLGAMQNRLEYSISNLNTASENMTSANSRIRDTDMAREMTTYTQFNVLTQAAQAMLAQANTQPQNILQLLQ